MLREGDKLPRTFKPLIKVVDGKRVPLTFEDIEQIYDSEDKIYELEQELAWTKRRREVPLSFVTQFKRHEYRFYFKADEENREYDKDRAKLELRLLLLASDEIWLHSSTLKIVLTEKGAYHYETDWDDNYDEGEFTTLDEVFDYLEEFWEAMIKYKKELERALRELGIT